MAHVAHRKSRLLARMLATLLMTAIIPSAAIAESTSDSWQLVWSDEFDQAALDPAKWNHEVGGHGWGNEEVQFYTTSTRNCYTRQGKLVIEALAEEVEGRKYTSARITTKGKGDWKYGRVDVCAKLPFGQGIWPAIWMMPTDSVYGGWPKSGEIDIMELLGHDTRTVYGTRHYADADGRHAHTGDKMTTTSGDFSREFHVFSVIWEPGEITWLVDNVPFLKQQAEKPFDQRFYIILNLAVGGRWPKYPDETTTFPQRMEVEYVRVYQKPATESNP